MVQHIDIANLLVCICFSLDSLSVIQHSYGCECKVTALECYWKQTDKRAKNKLKLLPKIKRTIVNSIQNLVVICDLYRK